MNRTLQYNVLFYGRDAEVVPMGLSPSNKWGFAAPNDIQAIQKLIGKLATPGSAPKNVRCVSLGEDASGRTVATLMLPLVGEAAGHYEQFAGGIEALKLAEQDQAPYSPE